MDNSNSVQFIESASSAHTRVSKTRLCELTSEWMLVVSCAPACSGCQATRVSLASQWNKQRLNVPAAACARDPRAHRCLCCSHAPATPGQPQPAAASVVASAFVSISSRLPGSRAGEGSHLRWPCSAKQRAPRPALQTFVCAVKLV